MYATVRTHDIADLPNLKRKRRVLERLLHLVAAEPAEVAALGVGAAVGVLVSEGREDFLVVVAGVVDLLLVAAEDGDGFLFGAGDVGLEGRGGTFQLEALTR